MSCLHTSVRCDVNDFCRNSTEELATKRFLSRPLPFMSAPACRSMRRQTLRFSLALWTVPAIGISSTNISNRFVAKAYSQGHRLWQANEPKHISKLTQEWMGVN